MKLWVILISLWLYFFACSAQKHETESEHLKSGPEPSHVSPEGIPTEIDITEEVNILHVPISIGTENYEIELGPTDVPRTLAREFAEAHYLDEESESYIRQILGEVQEEGLKEFIPLLLDGKHVPLGYKVDDDPRKVALRFVERYSIPQGHAHRIETLLRSVMPSKPPCSEGTFGLDLDIPHVGVVPFRFELSNDPLELAMEFGRFYGLSSNLIREIHAAVLEEQASLINTVPNPEMNITLFSRSEQARIPVLFRLHDDTMTLALDMAEKHDLTYDEVEELANAMARVQEDVLNLRLLNATYTPRGYREPLYAFFTLLDDPLQTAFEFGSDVGLSASEIREFARHVRFQQLEYGLVRLEFRLPRTSDAQVVSPSVSELPSRFAHEYALDNAYDADVARQLSDGVRLVREQRNKELGGDRLPFAYRPSTYLTTSSGTMEKPWLRLRRGSKESRPSIYKPQMSKAEPASTADPRQSNPTANSDVRKQTHERAVPSHLTPVQPHQQSPQQPVPQQQTTFNPQQVAGAFAPSAAPLSSPKAAPQTASPQAYGGIGDVLAGFTGELRGQQTQPPNTLSVHGNGSPFGVQGASGSFSAPASSVVQQAVPLVNTAINTAPTTVLQQVRPLSNTATHAELHQSPLASTTNINTAANTVGHNLLWPRVVVPITLFDEREDIVVEPWDDPKEPALRYWNSPKAASVRDLLDVDDFVNMFVRLANEKRMGLQPSEVYYAQDRFEPPKKGGVRAGQAGYSMAKLNF